MDIRDTDHLPQLEEVSASLMDIGNLKLDIALAWLVALVPAMMAFFVVFYLLLNGFNYYALLYPVAVEGILLALLWRYYLGGYRWKTDSSGLVVRNLFGCRRVNWRDVDRVVTRSEIFRLTNHILYSHKRVYRIPVAGNTQIAALGASIYQHLNPSISLDKMKLPEESKTIWCAIPEWIPRKMIWKNPKRPNTLLDEFSLLLLTAMSMLWTYYFVTDRSTAQVLMPLICIPLLLKNYAEDKIIDNGPVSIQLASDTLHIRPQNILPRVFSQILHIKWDDITNAGWRSDGYLQLSSQAQSIALPYNDLESQILILGIIRALREKNNPIMLTIPDKLLAVLESHGQ